MCTLQNFQSCLALGRNCWIEPIETGVLQMVCKGDACLVEESYPLTDYMHSPSKSKTSLKEPFAIAFLTWLMLVLSLSCTALAGSVFVLLEEIVTPCNAWAVGEFKSELLTCSRIEWGQTISTTRKPKQLTWRTTASFPIFVLSDCASFVTVGLTSARVEEATSLGAWYMPINFKGVLCASAWACVWEVTSKD